MFLASGERSKVQADFLQELQGPQGLQSGPVQEVEGEARVPGPSPLRQEAGWLRWTDQAHLPEEGI